VPHHAPTSLSKPSLMERPGPIARTTTRIGDARSKADRWAPDYESGVRSSNLFGRASKIGNFWHFDLPSKAFGADHGQKFRAQPENAPAAISEQWGLSTRDPGSRLWCRIRAGSRRPHYVFVVEDCIRRDPIDRGDVPGAVELMPKTSSDTVVRFHPAVPARNRRLLPLLW
jgi:hypothetical protein